MKILGVVGLHFLQILSVWQNWFDFKPNTIIINHQLEFSRARVKDNGIHNMAWWLKSAGALNFALSQEQCPISL